MNVRWNEWEEERERERLRRERERQGERERERKRRERETGREKYEKDGKYNTLNCGLKCRSH